MPQGVHHQATAALLSAEMSEMPENIDFTYFLLSETSCLLAKSPMPSTAGPANRYTLAAMRISFFLGCRKATAPTESDIMDLTVSPAKSEHAAFNRHASATGTIAFSPARQTDVPLGPVSPASDIRLVPGPEGALRKESLPIGAPSRALGYHSLLSPSTGNGNVAWCAAMQMAAWMRQY